MSKVNPALFEQVIENEANLDSPEKLINDEKFLEDECKKLNSIQFSQHFLPTTLRAQRFKDWKDQVKDKYYKLINISRWRGFGVLGRLR